MGIYTSDVHQTSNGIWTFLISKDSHQKIRGYGYKNEAEAREALKLSLSIIRGETNNQPVIQIQLNGLHPLM